MDTQRVEVLRAELEATLRKRSRLDSVIEYLQEELGINASTPRSDAAAPAAPDGGAPGSGGGVLPPDGDPSSLVAEAEFLGRMTGPKATVELLERAGRALTTDEIFNAIVKGGVNVKDRQGFYRTLFRDQRFHRAARSRWGLASWYPDSVLKASKTAPTPAAEQPVDEHSPEPDSASSNGEVPPNVVAGISDVA